MQNTTGSEEAESYIRERERDTETFRHSLLFRAPRLHSGLPPSREDHMRVSIVVAAASARGRLLLKHSALQAGRVNPILTAMTAPCVRARAHRPRAVTDTCSAGEHEGTRNDLLHSCYDCLCLRV